MSDHKLSMRTQPYRSYDPLAESRLEESLNRLKLFSNFKEISSKKIGEFWSQDSIRAPFEEALTFSQLLSIGLQNLIKKRSFTPAKMNAVSSAIDQAIIISDKKNLILVDSFKELRSGFEAKIEISWAPKWSLLFLSKLKKDLNSQNNYLKDLSFVLDEEKNLEDFLILWLVSEFGIKYLTSYIGNRKKADNLYSEALTRFRPIIRSLSGNFKIVFDKVNDNKLTSQEAILLLTNSNEIDPSYVVLVKLFTYLNGEINRSKKSKTKKSARKVINKKTK